MDRINIDSLRWGLFSLAPICLLLASAMFAINQPVNSLIFPLSLIVGGVQVYWQKDGKNSEWATFGAYILIISLFLIIAIMLPDGSWDGNSYHKDIISTYVNGEWSPFYNHHIKADHPMWTHHYAKGMELLAAAVYATTGLIESGKFFNFVFVINALLFAYRALNEINFGLTNRKILFYTVTIVLSTIVIGQILSYQIDFILYCLLLILASEFIHVSTRKDIEKESLITIVSVFVLLITAKFNFAFWGAFLTLFYIVSLLVKKQYRIGRRLIYAGVVAIVIGFCFVGFNPFVTNFMDHGTPLYPLIGSAEKVDILSNQILRNYEGKPEWLNAIISLFSHMGGDPNGESSLCLPLFFYPQDLLYYLGATSRAGGFGIFFSAIMILSLVVWYKADLISSDRKTSSLLLIGLLCSLFILPGSWWARYVPFFFVFPFIALLYSEKAKLPLWINRIRNFVFLLIAINFMLASGINISFKFLYKYRIEKSIKQVEQCEFPRLYFGDCKNVGYKVLLKEKGIEFEETDKVFPGMKPLYSSPPVLYIDLKKDK